MLQQVQHDLARGRADVEERRAAVDRDRSDVERDRADVDAERAKMRAVPPGVVKLNVGGVPFKVSRAVLTRVDDSRLGRMFGGCNATLQPDPDDGSIFIDRDGERFRLILDFLRDLDGSHTQRKIRALTEAAQESMMEELDYFGLEVAVFGARSWTDDAAFRPGPAIGSVRAYCAAVLVGGRVVVFGGLEGESPLNTTLLLDAQTMAFTAGPNLLTARMGCAAVLIDADRVLVVGGADPADDDNEGYEALHSTEFFHHSTLTLTPGPDLMSRRAFCAVVALDARRILVVGGSDGMDCLSTPEMLSLDTMTFAPGPEMTNPRFWCGAVALDEHRFMVAGGESGSERLNTTEVLDIRTMSFALGPSMSSSRVGCAAVAVDAQHVLVIGGADSASAALATTELLDVATMQFSPGPAMQGGRCVCTAVRVDVAEEEPRVIVIGEVTAPTRDSDEEEEEEENSCLSTTEVLAVGDQREARAPRFRRL